MPFLMSPALACVVPDNQVCVVPDCVQEFLADNKLVQMEALQSNIVSITQELRDVTSSLYQGAAPTRSAAHPSSAR